MAHQSHTVCYPGEFHFYNSDNRVNWLTSMWSDTFLEVRSEAARKKRAPVDLREDGTSLSEDYGLGQQLPHLFLEVQAKLVLARAAKIGNRFINKGRFKDRDGKFDRGMVSALLLAASGTGACVAPPAVEHLNLKNAKVLTERWTCAGKTTLLVALTTALRKELQNKDSAIRTLMQSSELTKKDAEVVRDALLDGLQVGREFVAWTRYVSPAHKLAFADGYFGWTPHQATLVLMPGLSKPLRRQLWRKTWALPA